MSAQSLVGGRYIIQEKKACKSRFKQAIGKISIRCRNYIIQNGNRREVSKDQTVRFPGAGEKQRRNERTEIVTDLERGGRRPILDVGTEIPTRSSTNGVVGRSDAAKENCRNYHHNYYPHCPTRSQCLHFSPNLYTRRRSTKKKLSTRTEESIKKNRK